MSASSRPSWSRTPEGTGAAWRSSWPVPGSPPYIAASLSTLLSWAASAWSCPASGSSATSTSSPSPVTTASGSRGKDRCQKPVSWPWSTCQVCWRVPRPGAAGLAGLPGVGGEEGQGAGGARLPHPQQPRARRLLGLVGLPRLLQGWDGGQQGGELNKFLFFSS